MFKCEYCDKLVKSKGGLKRHMSNCVNKPSEDTEYVEACNDKPEVLKESVGTSTELRIKKLKDKYKSTYDAHTRHQIELEIEELKDGI